MIVITKVVSQKAESNIELIAEKLKNQGKLKEYELLILLAKYMIDLYSFEVNHCQENRSIPQILSRTIMETYFYILYLAKSNGNKKEYQIKEEAYKLIAQRDEVKKLVNALYNDQLVNTHNPKDTLQRDKAREMTSTANISKTQLEEKQDNINDKLKNFLERNSIEVKPKDFKAFYSVSKDDNGKYLQGLQKLAIYVNEGERYNFLMHQTSKRVHATNVYQEYDVLTLAAKSNPDDNIPTFISTLFVGNALKAITNFCNVKSLFDKDLGKYVDNFKHDIQTEIDKQMKL